MGLWELLVQGAQLPDGCNVSEELRLIVRQALRRRAGQDESAVDGSVALDDADMRDLATLTCDTEKDDTYRHVHMLFG
jgi:hypothetical protein